MVGIREITKVKVIKGRTEVMKIIELRFPLNVMTFILVFFFFLAVLKYLVNYRPKTLISRLRIRMRMMIMV